jgi:hypothetical protein
LEELADVVDITLKQENGPDPIRMLHMETSVTQGQIVCGINGKTHFYMISPLQSHLLPLKPQQLNINSNPILRVEMDIISSKNEDLFPKMKHSQIMNYTLRPGDCLFIPAGWWWQSESDDRDTTKTVTFWYDLSSAWLKMFFKGLSTDQV